MTICRHFCLVPGTNSSTSLTFVLFYSIKIIYLEWYFFLNVGTLLNIVHGKNKLLNLISTNQCRSIIALVPRAPATCFVCICLRKRRRCVSLKVNIYSLTIAMTGVRTVVYMAIRHIICYYFKILAASIRLRLLNLYAVTKLGWIHYITCIKLIAKCAVHIKSNCNINYRLCICRMNVRKIVINKSYTFCVRIISIDFTYRCIDRMMFACIHLFIFESMFPL